MGQRSTIVSGQGETSDFKLVADVHEDGSVFHACIYHDPHNQFGSPLDHPHDPKGPSHIKAYVRQGEARNIFF